MNTRFGLSPVKSTWAQAPPVGRQAFGKLTLRLGDSVEEPGDNGAGGEGGNLTLGSSGGHQHPLSAVPLPTL